MAIRLAWLGREALEFSCAMASDGLSLRHVSRRFRIFMEPQMAARHALLILVARIRSSTGSSTSMASRSSGMSKGFAIATSMQAAAASDGCEFRGWCSD